jgi:hypothetical protein
LNSSPPLPLFSAPVEVRQIGLTAAAARKALQDSLQEGEGEEDEDEQRYLNLNEEEGDVWDDDSAYIEMLAKECVPASPLPSSFPVRAQFLCNNSFHFPLDSHMMEFTKVSVQIAPC